MIAVTTLLLMAQTATPPAARRPPDERVQDHGQNAVVQHDPIGGKVDIVAEDVGKCPGPGPTTIMRLRSADKAHTIVADVVKTVNTGGTITTSKAQHTIAPLAAVDLGCLAQPSPNGGKPLSTTEWKIVASHIQ